MNLRSNSPLNVDINQAYRIKKSKKSRNKSKSIIFDSDDSDEYNNLPKMYSKNNNSRFKSKTVTNMKYKNLSLQGSYKKNPSFQDNTQTGNTTFIRNRGSRFDKNNGLKSEGIISKNKKNNEIRFGEDFFINDEIPNKNFVKNNIQRDIHGIDWINKRERDNKKRKTSISRDIDNKNVSRIFEETNDQKINNNVKNFIRSRSNISKSCLLYTSPSPRD